MVSQADKNRRKVTKIVTLPVETPEQGDAVTITDKKATMSQGRNKGGRPPLPRDPLTGDIVKPKARSADGKPQSLASATQEAFDAVGGVEWLKRHAKDDPKAVMGAAYVPLVVPVEQRELSNGQLEPVAAVPQVDPFQ